MQPQNIYLPVSVEDEFPTEKAICFKGTRKLIFEWDGDNLKDLKATHWLKPIEGVFVFTSEEMEEHDKKVISDYKQYNY